MNCSPKQLHWIMVIQRNSATKSLGITSATTKELLNRAEDLMRQDWAYLGGFQRGSRPTSEKAGTVSGWTSPFRVSLFIVAGTHADGSPRTDRLIEASIQWAERIMRKIDPLFGAEVRCTTDYWTRSQHPHEACLCIFRSRSCIGIRAVPLRQGTLSLWRLRPRHTQRPNQPGNNDLAEDHRIRPYFYLPPQMASLRVNPRIFRHIAFIQQQVNV